MADDGENIERQAAQTKQKAWEREGGNTGTTTARKARLRDRDHSYQSEKLNCQRIMDGGGGGVALDKTEGNKQRKTSRKHGRGGGAT
jgi:hypothetical protein